MSLCQSSFSRNYLHYQIGVSFGIKSLIEWVCKSKMCEGGMKRAARRKWRSFILMRLYFYEIHIIRIVSNVAYCHLTY